MDSMNSNFPPPPSVSSTITETQSEIKENTGSSGLANSNVDVKSTVSEDTSVSHINSSNIPATTAATSAAFINVATAAPSPPISINYPPGIQNGIGGSNAISNTEPNVSISHKHVLPPPSASAISNGMFSLLFLLFSNTILTTFISLQRENQYINFPQYQILTICLIITLVLALLLDKHNYLPSTLSRKI